MALAGGVSVLIALWIPDVLHMGATARARANLSVLTLCVLCLATLVPINVWRWHEAPDSFKGKTRDPWLAIGSHTGLTLIGQTILVLVTRAFFEWCD